jgi:hypothetical protein
MFACLDPDRFDCIAEATLRLFLEQLQLLVHQIVNSSLFIKLPGDTQSQPQRLLRRQCIIQHPRRINEEIKLSEHHLFQTLFYKKIPLSCCRMKRKLVRGTSGVASKQRISTNAPGVALVLTTAGGKSIAVQLPITATVLQLKRAVEKKEGIRVKEQSIYFVSHDELPNKQRLSDLGIDGKDPVAMSLTVKATKQFTLKVTLPNFTCDQSFSSAKEASAAAWQICEEHELELPSEEWQIDHARYGLQSSYNLMVPAGDWEPNEVFKKYVTRSASRAGAGFVLEDGAGRVIKVARSA